MADLIQLKKRIIAQGNKSDVFLPEVIDAIMDGFKEVGVDDTEVIMLKFGSITDWDSSTNSGTIYKDNTELMDAIINKEYLVTITDDVEIDYNKLIKPINIQVEVRFKNNAGNVSTVIVPFTRNTTAFSINTLIDDITITMTSAVGALTITEGELKCELFE